jgi:hypothetical protein
MQNPPRGPQLNVILDDDVALGQYSNLALVNASPWSSCWTSPG